MCDASYTYWLFLIYIRAIRSSILCLRAIREIRCFVSLVFCLGGRSYIKNLDISLIKSLKYR